MKKCLLSVGVLASLCMAGCGGAKDSKDAGVLVNSDFETLVGWIPDPQNATLTAEKAHSGRYAIKVDGGHDYSLGFKVPLGQLHETRVKKIKVSAWAFSSAPDAQASLVTAVGNPADPNKPLLWEALELNKNTASGKWVEVSKVITIPETATPASTLGFYLWRTGGPQAVYLDDLQVTVEP